MFGMFKKKESQAPRLLSQQEQFSIELAEFAARFNPVISELDPTGGDEMARRGLRNYLERGPEDKDHHVASDYYVNAYTGAMFELTDRGLIKPSDSLSMFMLTNSFMRQHPQHHTDLVDHLMGLWRQRLTQLGVM